MLRVWQAKLRHGEVGFELRIAVCKRWAKSATAGQWVSARGRPHHSIPNAEGREGRDAGTPVPRDR